MIKVKLLEDKIKNEGQVLPGNILKVDGFLNHQIDTELFIKMGEDFADHFKNRNITKVLTLEVSGIAVAFAVAYHLGVPVVFAKKTHSVTLSDDVYTSKVFSQTKKTEYSIRVDKKFLNSDDNVLLIDDFLAVGHALGGMIELCNKAGAKIVGVGIAVEKVFQGGGEKYRKMGYDVYSQAKISKFSDDGVVFE
nr:xanthine phosphoribosyltransferase [Campylobacter anatolicus]